VATEPIAKSCVQKLSIYKVEQFSITYYPFESCFKEISTIRQQIDERSVHQLCVLALPVIIDSEVDHVLVMNKNGWLVQKSAYFNCWLRPFADMESWPPGEHLIGLVSSRTPDKKHKTTKEDWFDTGFVWLHLAKIRKSLNPSLLAVATSLVISQSKDSPYSEIDDYTILNRLLEKEPKLLHRIPCGCNYQITAVIDEHERRKCKWTKQVYIAQKDPLVSETEIPLREKSLLDVILFSQTIRADPSLFTRLNPYNQPRSQTPTT